SRERHDCHSPLLPVRFTYRGDILSCKTVVTSSTEKLRLGKTWNAVAVDMESAGVAQAAARKRLPFFALKSITDSAEQSLSIDFNRCRSEDNSFSLWAIARQGLSSSRRAKDLWMLARNSRQAAGNLAAALAPV